MKSDFRVRLAHWPEDAPQLQEIRERVFIVEQHVPVELEWDGKDPDCIHALAMDKLGHAIGSGRLLPDGHIGRMAVLSEWRGQGVGKQLMKLLMLTARDRGLSRLLLNAQVSVIPFYQQFGFTTRGEVFEEAGIPHLEMVLGLPTPN